MCRVQGLRLRVCKGCLRASAGVSMRVRRGSSEKALHLRFGFEGWLFHEVSQHFLRVYGLGLGPYGFEKV